MQSRAELALASSLAFSDAVHFPFNVTGRRLSTGPQHRQCLCHHGFAKISEEIQGIEEENQEEEINPKRARLVIVLGDCVGGGCVV